MPGVGRQIITIDPDLSKFGEAIFTYILAGTEGILVGKKYFCHGGRAAPRAEGVSTRNSRTVL